MLFFALLIFRGQFSSWLWVLPFVILIQTLFSMGIALVLSALNVYYRDTAMIMNVLMLAWFFLTPVVYSASIIPDTVNIWGFTINAQRWQYVLNPMASLINVYRDLLYWGYRTDLDFFIRTTLTAVCMFLFGYWFFIRNCDKFGEEL